ncbi:CCR4-NOT transcription complex subunit 2 [Dissostichus eleginoides]|uniref:CCR4-NOT transcription complex subunit 2 n=1 Tax=Dissostichus eleginoides TaxID=100907 RepID=A0AAD9B0Q1_DISEL|nr:CCR4-NOT transcription complex subunit 2 [Dissostichus eleginoides]
MFGANRKKFMEGGIDNDYADDSSLYYTQQSMFPPHRPDKDMLTSSSASSTGQLCSGVSHAWDEQQCSAAVKSKWIKPTRKPTPEPRQHSEHRHDAHTPLTQQGDSADEHPERPEPQPAGRGPTAHIIGMPKQQQARQPFTINSMSGFGVNRNPGYNMNSSLSNNIFNGTADRSRRDGGSNPTPLLNPLAGRAPYVGMVTKPSNEQSQDFSIHNEDFPALPGPNYQSKDPSSTSEDSKTNLNSSGKPASNSDGPKFPGDKSSAPSNNNQQKKGIQVLPDGRVTNIPIGMVTDQFGMIGLLTFIRAAETDPGMVHLALGSDLTTLGLNLNSPENLYPKFASPWASAPCRPQDIDFHVPSEYLTNIHIRDKLAAIKLSRYGEDLLFYLYYMNGGDLLQLLAAVELDWRYHKEERVWITRAPGMEPTLKTNAYERGTYYFFDCLNWRKVAKEFHLEYEKLEERPHVPSTFNYNPAQQAF